MPLFSWADVLRHGGQVVVLLLAGSLHSIVKDEVKEVLRRFLGLAKEQAEPLLRRARSLREERNGWTVVREVLKVLIGICVVVAATNAALGVRWGAAQATADGGAGAAAKASHSVALVSRHSGPDPRPLAAVRHQMSETVTWVAKNPRTIGTAFAVLVAMDFLNVFSIIDRIDLLVTPLRFIGNLLGRVRLQHRAGQMLRLMRSLRAAGA